MSGARLICFALLCLFHGTAPTSQSQHLFARVRVAARCIATRTNEATTRTLIDCLLYRVVHLEAKVTQVTGGVYRCCATCVGVHYTHRETETDSQVVAQTAQGKERKKPWPPPCSVSTFRPAALRYVYVSSLALGRLWKVSRLADHTRTYVRQLSDAARRSRGFLLPSVSLDINKRHTQIEPKQYSNPAGQ